MKQTTASPTPEERKSGAPTDSRSPGAAFVVMALDMSWRLTLIVLIPILGGFQLDKKLNTSPLFTLVGFVLAMAGTAYVLWWASKKADSLAMPKGGAK
jgi:F0F1-type ATP synthase assembly protein I